MNLSRKETLSGIKAPPKDDYKHKVSLTKKCSNADQPLSKCVSIQDVYYSDENINESLGLPTLEHDNDFFKEKTFYENFSDMFTVESMEDSNVRFGVYETRGDQKEDSELQHKPLLQTILMQKTQIDKLLIENEATKELNSSLVSQNDVKLQRLSDTIVDLQNKVRTLTSRFESLEIDSEEKKNAYKELMAIIKDLPSREIALPPVKSNRNVKYGSYNPEVNSRTTTGPINKTNRKFVHRNYSLKVLCRVRPDISNCLSIPNSCSISLPPFKHNEKGLNFQLNRIFGPSTEQYEIFSEIIPIFTSCFTGNNACILAYGQSGSGKTHTMIGTDTQQGVIMLSMKELFKIAKNDTAIIFKFYLTILEIYNENIYDLIGSNNYKVSIKPNSRVILQENGLSVQITDVAEVELNNETEFGYYIKKSLKRRSSSIKMKNIHSSQSQYVVMVRVTGFSGKIENETNKGSLIMCDLAGSETYIEHLEKEQTELKYVNTSIAMLTRVFDAMCQKKPLIPFRDSKLTHILKPSLVGNSKCVFIACISPKRENLSDTHRTLNMAKKVEKINHNNI